MRWNIPKNYDGPENAEINNLWDECIRTSDKIRNVLAGIPPDKFDPVGGPSYDGTTIAAHPDKFRVYSELAIKLDELRRRMSALERV